MVSIKYERILRADRIAIETSYTLRSAALVYGREIKADGAIILALRTSTAIGSLEFETQRSFTGLNSLLAYTQLVKHILHKVAGTYLPDDGSIPDLNEVLLEFWINDECHQGREFRFFEVALVMIKRNCIPGADFFWLDVAHTERRSDGLDLLRREPNESGAKVINLVWVHTNNDLSEIYRGTATRAISLHSDQSIHDMEVGFNNLIETKDVVSEIAVYLLLAFPPPACTHEVFHAHGHAHFKVRLQLGHIDDKIARY